MEEPLVRGNATTVSHGGRLINTTLLPEAKNLAIAKAGGPGKEFFVCGENFPNQPNEGEDSNDYEGGAWRIEVSPRKASGTDYFLNVMQVTGTSAPAGVAKGSIARGLSWLPGAGWVTGSKNHRRGPERPGVEWDAARKSACATSPSQQTTKRRSSVPLPVVQKLR
jgi:hypothetical protein